MPLRIAVQGTKFPVRVKVRPKAKLSRCRLCQQADTERVSRVVLPVPFSQPPRLVSKCPQPCFLITGKVVARTNKSRAPALAYLRTSSAANVGTDKDSEKRQRHAIQGFAKRAGFGIVDEFYDAAVSGADPIETRAGFAALLDRIEGNGVRTVIVEDASRFARELMAQSLAVKSSPEAVSNCTPRLIRRVMPSSYRDHWCPP